MNNLKNKIQNFFGPRPASTVLAELRSTPEKTFKNFGFIVKRNSTVVLPTAKNTHNVNISANLNIGGRCKIECTYLNDIYKLEVKLGESYNDWYIPFEQKKALYCDVPKGMPNGTLIVTAPMNGCALEVHSSMHSNRFWHDSNGEFMPEIDQCLWRPKFRVDADIYEGKNAPLQTLAEKNTLYDVDGQDIYTTAGFEHSIIAVKRGAYWFIYQTAVYTSRNNLHYGFKYQKVPGPPIFLGQFLDDEPFAQITRPRQDSELFAPATRPRQDSEFFPAIATRQRRGAEP